MGRHGVVAHAGVTSVGARSLRWERGGRLVLDDVSCEARAGEVLAVTGPSGSGKSTLLAMLAGLETPDSGEVFVDGVVRSPGRRDGFGLVLQGYGLVATLTAAENIEVPLQAAGVPREEVHARAAAALDDLGLGDLGPHLVEELSGGQQQRVAIARSLVVRPAVLLADELTAELDAATQQRALELVFGRADQGAVVVLATHDPHIADLADHEVHLRDGVLEVRR